MLGEIFLKNPCSDNVKFARVRLNFHATPIQSIRKWSVSTDHHFWSLVVSRNFYPGICLHYTFQNVKPKVELGTLYEILNPCGAFRTTVMPNAPCLMGVCCRG